MPEADCFFSYLSDGAILLLLNPNCGAALPTLERNRPDLVSDRPRTYVASTHILTDVLDRVRLKGTVIFH